MRQHIVFSKDVVFECSKVCNPVAQTAYFQFYVDPAAQDCPLTTITQEVQSDAFRLGVIELLAQTKVRHPLSTHIIIQQVL